jgi:hypothetical protein
MIKAHRFLASLLVPLAVLVLGASMALTTTPATAFRGHVFGGAFGSEGSGDGQFKEPSGVAVSEATSQVYVLDQGNNRVERFSSAGVYEAQFDGSETPAKAFAFGTLALTSGISVDNSCYFKKLKGTACATADPSNGDVYVTDPGNQVVDKFNSAGAYLGQLQEASGGAVFIFSGGGVVANPAGVAVDASGTVWTYYRGQHVDGDIASYTDTIPNAKGEANTFIATRQLSDGPGFVCPGFAVDSKDNFYVREAGNQPRCSISPTVSKYGSGGVPRAAPPLIVPFDAEETSAVAVDLSSDEVFLDNLGSVGAFNSSGTLQERFGAELGVAHLTGGGGLAVNRENGTDSTVYVADGVADRVVVFTPEPPGPPIVVGESVSNVSANSATFEAEIDPRGASTEYRFEYGPCVTPSTCASSAFVESVPVPDGVTGAGFEAQRVSAHPQDLVAGTVYRSRVVAHNEKNAPGTVVAGEGGSFTTQPAGVFGLPDGRAWEMVSPSDKHGALLGWIGSGGAGVVQASAGGDAIVYLAGSPTETEPQGDAIRSQVLSTRGSGGWASRDIAPPHETATGQPVGGGEEYRFFSEDLSLGVVQPFGAFTPSLSTEASEQTAFLRSDYFHGHAGEACVESCYRPLVTGAPGHENVPEGTAFGEEGKCPPKSGCGPQFQGATPDLSHVVLNSNVPLSATAVKGSLYEWSGGQLALLSVLPASEGGAAVPATFGGSVDLDKDARHAISNDGSLIVWTTISSVPHLYLRDSAREETVRLDTGLTGTPEFQTATADLSEVFFTDSGDLYEYDVAHGELSRLTTGAETRVSVLGASEDGSYVYFVANGVLAAGAVPGKCVPSTPLPEATCNLYVRHDGTIRLVRVLSGADNADWSPSRPSSTARVSPDGGWLAFMSQRSLTGYDNRDAISGKPDEEVFLYEAEHERVVCASCDPTGARPLGAEYGQLGASPSFPSLAGGGSVWGPEQWLAANIPGWTPNVLGEALYQSRYLSDRGRLLFNSNEALVPKDVNGTWDVYEYEPPGVGGCSVSSVTFGERSGGCVGPLSSGSSPDESAFLDASETGSDVFFLTAAKLLSQDNDTSLDIYDAHECTGASPCLPVAAVQPPPCSTGDACKAAPSPQPSIFGAPASATFSGAGNVPLSGSVLAVKPRFLTRVQKLARALRACTKMPKKRRSACVKRAQHAYGPVGKAKKSNRRAR